MPQLDFSTFLPQIFWLFISLSFLYIVLSRYALPRVSDVIEERKDIIAQDIDSAKKFSSETELAIEELNMKLSEAKINSQSLMNDSLQEIKESNEEKKAILLKEINDDIVAAEAKIQEKKEESLSEISSVSEDIAIEMLENLSIGEIDKEKVVSLSRKVKRLLNTLKVKGNDYNEQTPRIVLDSIIPYYIEDYMATASFDEAKNPDSYTHLRAHET